MNGLQRAQRESRRWICIAGQSCERACQRAHHPRFSEADQRDARWCAEYWSNVAFAESKRLARLRAGDNQQGIKP